MLKITKIKIKSAPDGIPTGDTKNGADLGPYEENVLDLADELTDRRKKSDHLRVLERVLGLKKFDTLRKELGVKVRTFFDIGRNGGS